MEKELVHELQSATSELTDLLSSFSPEQFNKVPFEGSWTAGQLATHMHKSYGVADLLYGPVKGTTRDPGEKIPKVKDIFLNFDTKMKSPDFIVPEQKIYDKTSINALKDSINKIKHAAETLDLNETCTAFALPGMGEMTRKEWIYFVIYHTQRHVHQLKNIAEKVQQANNL